MTRESRARWLAFATAMAVVLLTALFSVLRNLPSPPAAAAAPAGQSVPPTAPAALAVEAESPLPPAPAPPMELAAPAATSAVPDRGPEVSNERRPD